MAKAPLLLLPVSSPLPFSSLHGLAALAALRVLPIKGILIERAIDGECAQNSVNKV